MPARYISVLGLGFGDCGKGLFVDAITRQTQAHTVVRFSGGAQAGHNVELPATAQQPQRHHTFAQFGSGSWSAGTRTVLLHPMIVHPGALLVEAEMLAQKGMGDALARLVMDARCRITTPFHQAAGRLRELLRGSSAHGTCGVGVGETVRHALEHPEQCLTYGELANHTQAGMSATAEKLQTQRLALLSELEPLSQAHLSGELVAAELKMLQDETLASAWLRSVIPLTRQCPPAQADRLASLLSEPGTVIFEGAQGLLLDEWRGFHPHTTWSSITTHAVEECLARLGLSATVEHLGVLRTYLTRHGHGPLPTHDAALDAQLPEPHNNSAGWQGHFRRGHPDAVLLRYALEVMGNLSGLLVSHLDVFSRGLSLKWGDSYDLPGNGGMAAETLSRLVPGTLGDLDHQAGLTYLLGQARPRYSPAPLTHAEAFLERVTSLSKLPVKLRSFGNTASLVQGLL